MASPLDSLIQLKDRCADINICFEKTLAICEESAKSNKDSFTKYASELFVYMDSINHDAIWVKGLMTIGKGYRTLNEFALADSTLFLAQEYASSLDQQYFINIERARVKRRMGHPKEGIRILNALVKRLKPNDPQIVQPEFYLVRGDCYRECENIADALRDYIKVKELTNNVPAYRELHEQAGLYISEIYLFLKSYDSLQKLHHETRKNAHDEEDYVGELFATYTIILASLQLKEFDETIREGYRAIQLKNQRNVSTAFGFIYACMGQAFLELNQLDSASYYIEKGIAFSRHSGEYKELADNLAVKANLLLQQGQYQQAKLVVEEALSLRDYHDEKLVNNYAIINDKLGKYKEAYHALRTNWDNWEETQAADESRKITSILLEERIKQDKQQQEQQFQHKMKAQRLWMAIGLLSLFLLMFAGYLYLQMKNTSKLEHLNQALKQQNQALEQFAHITSHDLKEPVRSISSFADLLLIKSTSGKFDDKEREYISFIQKSSKNLYSLIEGIKEFTDVSFSKQKPERVNINETINIVHQNLRQLMSEHNVLFEFHNPNSIGFVQFPKELLILTLQNLIQNGIKFNDSSRPKVIVTVFAKNQQTIFKVSDNGIGIDKKFHDQIFVPFKTLHNKFENKSSGLGLSICKNSLENNGGKIWVDSNEKSGSHFYFSI